MSQFTIVGKKFSPSAFADYAAHVPLDGWRPSLIVLHNTAAPSLKQRPNGLTQSHIEDLHAYYEFQAPKKHGKGWSGGPHLFVDQDGIWVFNPLDRTGVHSPTFNDHSWGVEMLGDFAAERFDAGDGLRVQTNAMGALAALYRRLGIATVTDDNLKLHKEDPGTDHDCPGRHVDKAKVKGAVQVLLSAASTGVWSDVPAKVVVYRASGGQDPVAILSASLRNGTVFADAKALSAATGIKTTAKGDVGVREFVGDRYNVVWKPETNRVYLAENA